MKKEIRVEMENKFGSDFSNVRIHTGSTAVQMSKDIRAQAFTHQNDIYFNTNKYRPDSREGKHLLAHELTHTIQQGVVPRVDRRPAVPDLQQEEEETDFEAELRERLLGLTRIDDRELGLLCLRVGLGLRLEQLPSES